MRSQVEPRTLFGFDAARAALKVGAKHDEDEIKDPKGPGWMRARIYPRSTQTNAPSTGAITKNELAVSETE